MATYQPPPQYGYAPPPPQRSAIPKVIGILMIIFASIGLLAGLVGLAGSGFNNDLFKDMPEFKTIRTLELVQGALGLGVGILHLYAGIRCVGYKANAVGLAKAYGIVAAVIVVLNGILTFALLQPMMNKLTAGSGVNLGGFVGAFTVIGMLIGLAWPTIILVLMTRPAAKEACVN